MNIAEIFAALDFIHPQTPIAFMNIKSREKFYALSGNTHAHRGDHSTYAFDRSEGDHQMTAEEFRNDLQWELDNTESFEWGGNLGQGPEYPMNLNTEIAITDGYRDSEGKILTYFDAGDEMIFFTHAY